MWNSPHWHTTGRKCWAAQRGRSRTARRARGRSRARSRAAPGRAAGPSWAGTRSWVGSVARRSPTCAGICVRSDPRQGTVRCLWCWGKRSRTVWGCSARWARCCRCSAAFPCLGNRWDLKLPSRRGRFSQTQHQCWSPSLNDKKPPSFIMCLNRAAFLWMEMLKSLPLDALHWGTWD